MMIDKQRIEEIRARHEAATGGEWDVYSDEEGGHTVDTIIDYRPFVLFNSIRFENAEFVAEAHQDIPFLLETISNLETLVKLDNIAYKHLQELYDEDTDALLRQGEKFRAKYIELEKRADQAALNYQQKCRDVVELEKRLAESERREKAAIEDLKQSEHSNGHCSYCKHARDDGDCANMSIPWVPCSVDNRWEWRGATE